MTARSIQQILAQDLPKLAAAQPDSSPRIELQSLLQHVLNVPRSYLLAHPERVLNAAEFELYHALLQRRLAGHPLAYLLGEREFFGLNFKVTPATLIPRADTELLVELALARIPPSPPTPLPLAGEGRRYRVLDLGTGSGAIALSIAHHRPHACVTALDFSLPALTVAQHNAQRLSLPKVRFLHSDWFAAIAGERFDLIVSNPPYIAAQDPHLAQGDLRFEPASALASGSDGLRDIRHLIQHAAAHLTANGWLLLEHGYDQAEAVRKLLSAAGYNAVFSACDLAGIARVSGGRA
jgi:release factor glutamine methyltransferase